MTEQKDFKLIDTATANEKIIKAYLCRARLRYLGNVDVGAERP